MMEPVAIAGSFTKLDQLVGRLTEGQMRQLPPNVEQQSANREDCQDGTAPHIG